MLRAVIMCLRLMWLTTIQKGSPLGYGYFYRIQGMWLFDRQVCCLYLLCRKPWLMLLSCSSAVLACEPCCALRLALALRYGLPFFFFPPMTVLKNSTISSFCPSSFWIMDRNYPNSIFPDLSSSTESISALISSLVSNNPTEKSNSSSSSMPMEPDFFSSRELKYCFISLRSWLSKSMRYFFPFLISHLLSSYCLRQCQWSCTYSACRFAYSLGCINLPRFLCERINSLTLSFSMPEVRSATSTCISKNYNMFQKCIGYYCKRKRMTEERYK